MGQSTNGLGLSSIAGRQGMIREIYRGVFAAAWIVGLASHGVAEAAPIRVFNDLQAYAFAQQPGSPYMYATLPSQNSVAVINTTTLELEGTYFVGSNPLGMS